MLGDYAPSHHILQCISLLSTLLKRSWGLGPCDTCYVLKNHRRLEFFPPASSLGLLVSNSQHAASLYKKLEFGHLKVEKRRRKRANNSVGTGWGEEDAEGFQLRFPPAVPAFQLLSTIFLTHSLLSGFTLERTFVCLVFYHPAHVCSFVVFSSPLPPCCPLLCFLIEISLMHFFFFLFQWLILSSLCFCLQSFFSFFTALFLPLVPQEKRPPSRWDRMTVLLEFPVPALPKSAQLLSWATGGFGMVCWQRQGD